MLIDNGNLSNPMDFKLISQFPLSPIEPDSTRSIIFEFTPSKTGDISGILTLESNSDPDSVLTIPITGRKDSVAIVPEIQIIDLGFILPNETKDTLFLVKNYGTIPTGFSIKATPNIITNTLKFVLLENDQEQINVHFIGITSSGIFSDTVTITDSTCYRSYFVIIKGEIIDIMPPILQVVDAEAKDGEEVDILIYLNNSKYAILSGLKEISFDLTFNSTLLIPNYEPIGTVINNKRIIPLIFPITNDSTNLLGKLRMIAGLGNAPETFIKIENIVAKGSLTQIDTINGIFKLIGICKEGGDRLINPEGQVQLMSVIPNPSGESVEIEMELIENGNTMLYLANINGENVRTIFEGSPKLGVQKMQINTKDIPSGTYFIVLKTPTMLESKKMEIIK